MRNFLHKALYWKLAIFRAGAGILLACILFSQDKFHTIAWTQMAADDKILFFLALAGIVLTNLLAFLDQSVARLKEGSGDTERIFRSVEVKTEKQPDA